MDACFLLVLVNFLLSVGIGVWVVEVEVSGEFLVVLEIMLSSEMSFFRNRMEHMLNTVIE